MRPLLEYSASVWDPHHKCLQDKLERVQKRAARYITGNYHDYEEGSMTSILKSLELPTLQSRRKHSRLTLFYKGLNGKATIPVHKLPQKGRKSRHGHEHQFRVVSTKTDSYKFSFIPRTIVDWNAIAISVLSACENATNKITTFKTQIKKID